MNLSGKIGTLGAIGLERNAFLLLVNLKFFILFTPAVAEALSIKNYFSIFAFFWKKKILFSARFSFITFSVALDAQNSFFLSLLCMVPLEFFFKLSECFVLFEKSIF